MAEEMRVCPVDSNYMVSANGQIFRVGRDEPLKPCILKRGGYLAVSLWSNGRGKTWPVHQLVCMTFHGPRPSERHHAAHWDGDKSNCRATNLRWATREENEADKIRHGKTNRGERNGQAVLTDAQVAEIKRRLAAGERCCNLAREYGVGGSAISNIKRGARRAA